GVHERELRSRVRRSSAAAPRVSDESARGIELALVDDLALVDGRPTDDQLERSLVGRSGTDVVEPGLEMIDGCRHGSILRWRAGSPRRRRGGASDRPRAIAVDGALANDRRRAVHEVADGLDGAAAGV